MSAARSAMTVPFPTPRGPRFGSGVAVVAGALLMIYALLFPRREVIQPGPVEQQRLDQSHGMVK